MMRRLVVGVDGTDAARVALEWAAETVGPEGHIHAIVAVDPATEFVVDVMTGDPQMFLTTVFRDLESEWTRAIHGSVAELTTDLVERRAADALVAAAAEFHADAIVVGAHVTHLGPRRRIGSTTRHLLRKLDGPLIVVPTGATDGLRVADRDQLVVGVGHSDATDAAVRWATELADRRNLGVALVRAIGNAADPAVDDLVGLAELVQESSGHELPIDVAAVPGMAAVRLAEASQGAALLVIGQHRSAITAGRHVTQPLRHLLTHTHCPVAVVPEWVAGKLSPDEPAPAVRRDGE
ncbi:MAG: universal stress protein [Ilumatobacter sp.]|nr:universal stress protein [Ilumatobacter sp.]